ncbi:MAG TPA: hypothetical protein VG895_05530 [Patescibacteria group bacterium]|nr:hypothetical protein [Patescibacteria group bacterium]
MADPMSEQNQLTPEARLTQESDQARIALEQKLGPENKNYIGQFTRTETALNKLLTAVLKDSNGRDINEAKIRAVSNGALKDSILNSPYGQKLSPETAEGQCYEIAELTGQANETARKLNRYIATKAK